MSCNDHIVDLIVSEEGPGLAKFSSNKEAKGSAHYACSGTEDQVEGANVFVVG